MSNKFMDWSLENYSPHGPTHDSLSPCTHTCTRGEKRAKRASPELCTNGPHQSVRCIRDCGDNKMYRRLTDQISTYTYATLLLGQDTHPLSTPGLSHYTELRLVNTEVERGWKMGPNRSREIKVVERFRCKQDRRQDHSRYVTVRVPRVGDRRENPS